MPPLIQIQPSDLGFCWPIQYFKNNIGFVVTFKNQEISLKKFLYLLKYQKVSQHQASVLTCKKKKKKSSETRSGSIFQTCMPSPAAHILSSSLPEIEEYINYQV